MKNICFKNSEFLYCVSINMRYPLVFVPNYLGRYIRIDPFVAVIFTKNDKKKLIDWTSVNLYFD